MGYTYEDLYEKLHEAIESGDSESILKIQKRLVLSSRNMEYDKNFIESIKNKPLGKNIRKALDRSLGSRSEWMKLLSSLITHIIIESDITGVNINEYSIKEVYSLLGNYVNDNPNAEEEVIDFLDSRYADFI